jgi:GDP-4-dehydro-6-deoxy-D-mannose reductase
MKTVLITGASGFVGGYLRKELVNSGYKVVGTDLNANNSEYIMDVTDITAVQKVVNEVHPDYIIHLAGFASVKESFNRPELCMKINVDGTRNLMEVLSKSDFSCKVLIISSADTYKDNENAKLDENSPQEAKSPYGESRLAQEKLVQTYKNVDWVISRSFPHIGPGQMKGFVSSDFASQIAEINNTQSDISEIGVGNLQGIRDFTDVRDTVVAYKLLLEKGKSHNIYNICTGKEVRIKELLDILLSFSKKRIDIIVNPDKVREKDIKYNVGDNSKLVNDTGWATRYEINQTLKDIYDYWDNFYSKQ